MRKLEGVIYNGQEVGYEMDGDTIRYYSIDKPKTPFHTTTAKRARDFTVVKVSVLDGNRQSALLSASVRKELESIKGIPDRFTLGGEEYFIKEGRVYQGSSDPGPGSPAWKTPEDLKLYEATIFDMVEMFKSGNNGKGRSERPLVEDKGTISGGFLTGHETDKIGTPPPSKNTAYRPSGVTIGEKMREKHMLVADV